MSRPWVKIEPFFSHCGAVRLQPNKLYETLRSEKQRGATQKNLRNNQEKLPQLIELTKKLLKQLRNKQEKQRNTMSPKRAKLF